MKEVGKQLGRFAYHPLKWGVEQILRLDTKGIMSGGESQGSGVLSDRELQIVELVASGLTNQEIAEKLEISKRTVDNHVSNILTKTATGNRVALVRWALQWGKVCLDQVNCCVLPVSAEETIAQGEV
jgi:DNA-binding CsgD family transcriptional regulator